MMNLKDDLIHDFYYAFAQEDDFDIQSALMTRSNLPEEIIMHIAGKTQYIDILVLICEHPNTPTILLEEFGQMKAPAILTALASNKNTSKQLLSQLANSSIKEISFLAKNNLNID